MFLVCRFLKCNFIYYLLNSFNPYFNFNTGDLQKESSEDLIQDRISELSDQIRGDTITLEEHMGTVKELGISNSKSEWIQGFKK